MSRKVELRRQLNAFDVTSLVVGSIIGADIYVAAALGARLVGPFSLLIWVLAGLMATAIALCFSYCATVLPRVGGPYSYVGDVGGPFKGFIVGWSLLLAEWVSLAVFPVAFTQYFLFFLPNLDYPSQTLLKVLFIAIIFVTNVFGVKGAGRFNDLLTIGKLGPLVLLTVAGLLFIGWNPGAALSNFQPFVKGDLSSFGLALVLIFWAYAGFELSTLPADEIQDPQKTIPRAITMGMLIVIIFYLTTNFAIMGVVDEPALASSSAPLLTAGVKVFSFSSSFQLIGSLIVGAGALVSITGADESGTLGTSRLAYAMSADGLLPRMFSRLHRFFSTPYISLALICSTAFIASIVGTLTELISASVFLLSFAYLATSASSILLIRKYPQSSVSLRGKRIIPIMGMIFSLALMAQVNLYQILTSSILLLIGIPIYIFFSPKHELHEVKEAFLSRDRYLARAYEQGERFLAHPIRHLKWLIYRARRFERAWKVTNQRKNTRSSR
jgi:APA family basic amino acid/polyamine antiporter